jgi:hypothetical protein
VLRKFSLPVLAIFLVLSVFTTSPAEAKSYKITAKVSKGWMTLGTTLEISGDVSPAVKNKTVSIQQSSIPLSSGSWKTIKQTHTNGRGHYRTIVKPTGAGEFRFRATTQKLGSRKGNQSAYKEVDVWVWVRLAMLLGAYENNPPIPIPPPDPQTIGGQTFADSWESDDDGTGQQLFPADVRQNYTWQRSCWKFRGTVGLDDDSAPGASGTLTVHPNTTTSATEGSLTPIVVELDRFNPDWPGLELTAARTGPDVKTIVAVGNPEVFCTTDRPTYWISH